MEGTTFLAQNQWSKLHKIWADGIQPISILTFNATIWSPELQLSKRIRNVHLYKDIQSINQ